jgi:hypothetical protein
LVPEQVFVPNAAVCISRQWVVWRDRDFRRTDGQRGQKNIEHVAHRIVEVLREIAAYPLSGLLDR